MSETQSRSFSRRVCDVFISVAFILLAIFSCETPTRESVIVKDPPNSSRRLGDESHTLSRTPFHTSNLPTSLSNFYRTIIDNNLFRPLGWTRPVPPPVYRLIGTIIHIDGETPPQALILATADQKTYIVSPGDKLAADTTVIEIRSKHVILESGGQCITLKLDTSAWLSTSKRRSHVQDNRQR